MPKAPTTSTTPRKRAIDWKKYGARSADDSDRLTWRAADVDDTITGTLARVDEANTRFGAKVLIELDDCTGVIAGGEAGPDGPYVLWPTAGCLNAFDDSEADGGDRVTITLTELIDTGKGNPFKQFEVTVATGEPF